MGLFELGIFGGGKTIDRTAASFALPVVAESSYPLIEEMLRKGEISMSPVVGRFERAFADYMGSEYALTVVNGTTSIQAALFSVGVGAGDEVIVPSFTFWATVGPVFATNAVPVFTDVDPYSMNLTAKHIEKKITNKTKAILLVHVWGTPCDMDSIMALAKKYNLKVIEDASHAHGATYRGKKVGTFGDIGCFSMQGSKTLPAGEGGILITNHREYFERACTLGSYERIRKFPDDSPYKKYSLTGFGYKHRIHPIAAAIAEGNLGRLDEINKIRNRNAHYFEELICDLDFIKPQAVPDDSERVFSYHYMRYIPEKFGNIKIVTLLSALSAEGVVCGSCGYGRLHKAPVYIGEGPYGHGCPTACPYYGKKIEPCGGGLPNTELLAVNAFLAAPRFEIECDEYIKLYAKVYHKIADNMDKLAQYEKDNLKSKNIENNGTSINYFSNEKGTKK